MLAFNPLKINCTGCSSCYSICPTGCIKMESDEEGFLYPVEHEGCIHCHLCEKVCPMCNPTEKYSISNSKVIAAVSKDKNIWLRSTSGGAFSEICRQWCDDKSMIVGATMDNLYVHHIAVIGKDNIGPICKSKYVSSSIENTFIEIHKYLKEGQKVIFCGCPCQVDGLNSFLRKRYENLLTIDLICHGQGSPSVFKTCMEVIGEDLDSQVVSYEFRTKNRTYDSDYIAKIITDKQSFYTKQDPYISLFLSQNCLRPACGKNCKYRKGLRPGDITLADCKGLSYIFPDLLGSKTNYSSVIGNSSKGIAILDILSQTMYARTYSIEDVKKYNPLICRQTNFSKNRDVFFEDYEKNKKNAVRKWGKPFVKYSPTLRHKVFLFAPQWIRRFMLKVYEIIKNKGEK